MSENSESDFTQEAFLNKLRQDMAAYLAQKLTFSLFQAGKSQQLKDRITELIEAKLLEDSIPLEADVKEALITQIMAGMPSLENEELPTTTPGQEEQFNTDELQGIMKPYLASMLSDDLFQPDRKEDLASAIVQMIDKKISSDEIPVPAEQRKELIYLICSKMNLTPPVEEPVPAPPAPATALTEDLEIESMPTAKIPSLTPRTEPVASTAPQPKKKIPKPAAGGMLPLKALTHEIKRDLLYDLSTKINSDTMMSGDELAVRTEIFSLIQAYCTQYRFTLSDQDVEKIVQEILSGEGLEFQL
jgi:hypothetical protein